MKPAAFAYHAPRTTSDALALLSTFGVDAKALAGGQSLIPAMNFRLASPAVLIDLNGIAELSHIVPEPDGSLRIGSMTRHRTLERSEAISTLAPLVTAAMPWIAHAAIRTRGTIGGSLAHADPAAELPAVMLALDARFTVEASNGTREIPAEDFFVGLFTTALEPGELLVDIRIPARPARSAAAFDEVSRRHGDFALAGAAASIAVDEAGVCTTARVGLFGLADRAVLSTQVSRTLAGGRPTSEAIRAAAEAAAAHDVDPTSDLHASSRYRRQLAAVLTRRVLERAFHALEPS